MGSVSGVIPRSVDKGLGKKSCVNKTFCFPRFMPAEKVILFRALLGFRINRELSLALERENAGREHGVPSISGLWIPGLESSNPGCSVNINRVLTAQK